MPQINGGLDMPLKDLKRHASMLRQSDVLLTEYSTLVIEAAIFDKPIINVGFGRYRNTNKPISYLETFTHIQRILKTQASRNAYSFDDLCKMLSLYLQDPSQDRQYRTVLAEQEVEINKGYAGRAIGDYLAGLK